MIKKKNIFFFLPVFSSGGAGASIIRLIKKLDKKKYDFFVISLGKNYYYKDLKLHCRKIFELKSKKTIISFSEIKNILKPYSHQKTIFVSNINYANILSVIFLKVINNLFNLRLVLIERTPLEELYIYYSFFDYFKKKIIFYLITLFYKRADLIICNSKKTSNDFEILTKKKCNYVYPQPIDKKLTFIKRKKKKIFNILTIARLSKEKRLQDIIMAVSNLNIKNIQINILGEGNLKSDLKLLCKEKKIKTKFVNYSIKNEKKYFKSANLYINSSDFEGFPSTVVQALNNSIPVVCSKSHGGIFEILNGGKLGKFYETRNYLDLAKKIHLVYKKYDIEINNLKNNRFHLKNFLDKKNLDKYNFLLNNL